MIKKYNGIILIKQIFVCVVFLHLSLCYAGEMNVTTYYGSPTGQYDRLRLVPRSSAGITCDSSMEGLIYYDKDMNQLKICKDNGPPAWTHFGGIWEQVDDTVTGKVYLKDTNTIDLSVGIGTNTPEFRLTLDKGAGTPDGGILAIGTFGSGAKLDTNGAGTRLIWYPKKAAFRAGRIPATQWDDVNIGNYSVSFGGEASGISSLTFTSGRSQGDYSCGIGGAWLASGDYSTILSGWGGTTAGLYSLGIGMVAVSSGESTTAIGQVARASGKEGTSLGIDNLAAGDYSTSLGSSNDSLACQAYCETCFGRRAVVSGNVSTWFSTEPLFVIGNGDAIDTHNAITLLKNGRLGINTSDPEFRLTLDKGETTPDGGILAIGTYGSGADLATTGSGTRFIWYPKKAAFRAGNVGSTDWDDANIGDFSVSFNHSQASGKASFSGNDEATADYATALMGRARASYATAITYPGEADGQYATALGAYSTASGVASTAIGGIFADAEGDYSVSIGLTARAETAYSVVVGRAPAAISGGGGSATTWVDTEPLFVIGRGGGGFSPGVNAVTLLKNGNMYVGTYTSPQSRLQIGGYLQESTITGHPPVADCGAGFEGRMRFDRLNNRLYICNGTQWVHADLH